MRFKYYSPSVDLNGYEYARKNNFAITIKPMAKNPFISLF